MQRRRFIKQIGSGLLVPSTLSLLPLLARASRADGAAAPMPERFFVLLRTEGGMDVTLGLDPQTLPTGGDSKDVFLEYRPEDILSTSGLRLGPAAAPLAPYSHRCAVINGVMMRRDAGHDVLNKYISSGSGDGRAATLPAELSSCFDNSPLGIVANSQLSLAARPGIVSSTPDIRGASQQFNPAAILERMAIPADGGTSLQKAQQALLRARPYAAGLAQRLEQLKAAHPQLEDPYVVAAAFASGAAAYAELRVDTQQLDSHSEHERTHLNEQKKVWTYVADFLKVLESTPYGQGSLLDATTVMVISEFSRTPDLNAAKGKDHNPYTNSVLLAGRGVQGGRVAGLSRVIPRGQSLTGAPMHIAVPFDYKAGAPTMSRAGASFIFPENVVRTVAKIMGDPEGFSSVPMDTPIVPGIVS